MPEILPTAKYLAKSVLDPMFANWTVRFPTAAPTATLPENFRAVVALLHASLLPDTIPIAEIRDYNIRISAGFLCERWCTSYRLARVYHAITEAMEKFEVPLNPVGVPFDWPGDIPGPDAADNNTVTNANKVFLPVVSATVLHEVGHAIHRGVAATKQEIELRCDDFALNYLLGKGNAAADEFITVATAIWLCCICSESLGGGALWNQSHPHPADRVRAFLEGYVRPYHAGQTRIMEAVEMLCVGHIWNLARLRRPEPFEYAMDDFRARNTGDPMVLLECLRQCWE